MAAASPKAMNTPANVCRMVCTAFFALLSCGTPLQYRYVDELDSGANVRTGVAPWVDASNAVMYYGVQLAGMYSASKSIEGRHGVCCYKPHQATQQAGVATRNVVPHPGIDVSLLTLAGGCTVAAAA